MRFLVDGIGGPPGGDVNFEFFNRTIGVLLRPLLAVVGEFGLLIWFRGLNPLRLESFQSYLLQLVQESREGELHSHGVTNHEGEIAHRGEPWSFHGRQLHILGAAAL
jgi:hypothetical protein